MAKRKGLIVVLIIIVVIMMMQGKKEAEISTLVVDVPVASNPIIGPITVETELSPIKLQSLKMGLFCSDTDGGKDYYTKGTVTMAEFEYTDYCLSDIRVKEYFCEGDGVIKSTWAEHTGYTCQNGALTQQSLPCYETDGGKDYYNRGTSTLDGQSFTDYCISSSSLKEYFCYGDWTLKSIDKSISGYDCANGKLSISGCTNPTADDGDYNCNLGYVYECENGNWAGRYSCGHTGETGDCEYGNNNPQSVSSASDMCETGVQPDEPCVNPTADDGLFHCTNNNIRQCDDGTWYFYKACSDYGSGYICAFSSSYVTSNIGELCEGITLYCADSDGGKDYNTKGTVTYDTQTFTDYCSADPNLIEYYCSGNIKMEETKNCKEIFGMHGCANGECVECTQDWHCVAKYEDGYTCTPNNLCQLTGNTCADYPDNYGSCSLEGGAVCSSDDKYILSGCSDLDPSVAYVYCWTQRTDCGSGKHCIIENLIAKCISGEPPFEPPTEDPCGGACLTFVEKCAKDSEGEYLFEGERYDCKISGFIWMLGIFLAFMIVMKMMGGMGKPK